MWTLETILHTHGGSKGIRLHDARILMDQSGSNSAMLPAGANDILSLRSGTHPILQNLRESEARLRPHSGLRSIPMVLLLKVKTMRLAR